MSDLDRNWRPEFGTIYTWFAMDKCGRIAVMVNNCFGDLPKVLLNINDVGYLLDDLCEFIWEESSKVSVYPEKKFGSATVDLFSAWRFQGRSAEDVLDKMQRDLLQRGVFSELNLPVNKGFYVYHGVEGDNPGVDYPVGYSGDSEMGDYFRFLVPEKFAGIKDFPESLRKGVVVSNKVDFSSDRLLQSSLINDYFPAMYQGE